MEEMDLDKVGRSVFSLHVMNIQYSYNCASSGRESELRRVRAAVAGQLTAVSTL